MSGTINDWKSPLHVMARIVRPNFKRGQFRPRRYRPRRGWLGNYYDREALVVLVAFALLCVVFYVKENWDRAERPMLGSAEIEVIDGDTVRRDGRLYSSRWIQHA